MLQNRYPRLCLLLVCCAFAGCSEESTENPANTTQDTTQTDTQTTSDAADADDSNDSGPDDSGPDAGTDSSTNAGTDAGTDAGPDAPDSDPTPVCGNSQIETGEECDDGNQDNNDACLSCINARCGDGFIRQNVESCDDGNAATLDGCSDICRIEIGFTCQGEPSVCASVCGDGIISGLEACDDANSQDGDYCNADCSAITGRCGDNIIQTNEVCDDGNNQNGDSCAANCQAISGFCGDGIVQANETCDDGNNLSNDYCSPNCVQITGGCGDSIIQTNEVCDDGNNLSNDYCAADCQAITGLCGDGITQTNEECDDGNATVGDYCSNGCILTGMCGDGIVQTLAGEACDDANATNGDGCNATCTATEPGWVCFGTPTSCTAIVCAADQRVQSNTCVACPPGTTNLAGDDASGPNTTCDSVFCGVDQHVQSNACVACAPGTTNAVGDNASGGNTSCDSDACYLAFGVSCATFEQAYIKSPNPGTYNHFGWLIALDGDTLAVSAYPEDSDATGINGDPFNSNAPNSGAVYVFVRAGTTWTQQAYIKASNASTGDNFGRSIALSGDTLAVSAHLEDSSATGIDGDQTSNATADSGAVYVFTRSGTTWTQQAYIKASNTRATDHFGHALALSGDTLAVGSFGEDSSATGIDGDQTSNIAGDSGAVYVFTRSGTTWAQQAYIKASNTGSTDRFGAAVAVAGDTLAVGAPFEDSVATGINGNQTDNSVAGSGAVYVFTRAGTTWSQQAYLKASNTGGGDNFGGAVALSGDTLAVGAHLEDSVATGVNGSQTDNSVTGSGAVYVFTRAGTAWSQQAYVKASNTGPSDEFGQVVALSGDLLVVGAPYENSNATNVGGDSSNDTMDDSGAVYVFTRAGTTWTQAAYVKASNTGTFDQFGSAVALSGDTLAIGAIGEDSNATTINGDQTNNAITDSGAVYVRKIQP